MFDCIEEYDNWYQEDLDKLGLTAKLGWYADTDNMTKLVVTVEDPTMPDVHYGSGFNADWIPDDDRHKSWLANMMLMTIISTIKTERATKTKRIKGALGILFKEMGL